MDNSSTPHFGRPSASSQSSDPRTYGIIGAALEVHRELGCGFVEPVYQDAFEFELASRGISYRREVELRVLYKGQQLPSYYKPDFICYDEVIVELKALADLSSIEESQLLNYLKATGFPVGLLLNFGQTSLQVKRLIPHDDWQTRS